MRNSVFVERVNQYPQLQQPWEGAEMVSRRSLDGLARRRISSITRLMHRADER